jgi:hypothetical protein
VPPDAFKIRDADEILLFGLLACGPTEFAAAVRLLEAKRPLDAELISFVEKRRSEGVSVAALVRGSSDDPPTLDIRGARGAPGSYRLAAKAVGTYYMISADPFIRYVDAQAEAPSLWRAARGYLVRAALIAADAAAPEDVKRYLRENDQFWTDKFWPRDLFNEIRGEIHAPEILPRDLAHFFRMGRMQPIQLKEELTPAAMISWVEAQSNPAAAWTRIADFINAQYGAHLEPKLDRSTAPVFLRENPDMYGKTRPRSELLAAELQAACIESRERVVIPDEIAPFLTGGRDFSALFQRSLNLSLAPNEGFARRLVLESVEEVAPPSSRVDVAAVRAEFQRSLEQAQAAAAGTSYAALFALAQWILSTQDVRFETVTRADYARCCDLLKARPISNAGEYRFSELLSFLEYLQAFGWGEDRLRDALAVVLCLSDMEQFYPVSVSVSTESAEEDAVLPLGGGEAAVRECWRKLLPLYGRTFRFPFS